MHNFVLLHGAWHHPSCWDALCCHLEPYGSVHTPNLIGDLSYTEINFKHYLKNLTNIIAKIKKPVILIGHSFAGFVMTEYAKIFPQNISKLIYINSFLPKNNHSLLSLCENFEHKNLNPYLQINKMKNEISISSVNEIKKWMYNCTHHSRLRPQDFRIEPFLPLTEPIKVFTKPIPNAKAIICEHDLVLSKHDQIKMCEENNITYQLIDADHCPFLSAPQVLSQIILEGII